MEELANYSGASWKCCEKSANHSSLPTEVCGTSHNCLFPGILFYPGNYDLIKGK